MEKDQEQKHRCKVCRKSFPCGRSLGGHMRSHVLLNSSPEADEPAPTSSRSYGLRENPKKTTRLHDDLGDPLSSRWCGECGREFPSSRALFGHMRCHSVRKEGEEQEQEEQEGSWSGESQSAASMVPRRKRRSRRTAAIRSPSSPASEYELELEDVALSLMILSRDVGFWGGAHFVAESSDKNSAVLENKGAAEEGEGDFVSDGFEIGKKGSESSVLKNGYGSNVLNKMESDESDSEFKKPKMYAFDADNFEHSDEESGKGSSKKRNLNCSLDELGKKTGFNQSNSQVRKLASSNSDRIHAFDAKFCRNYVARFGFDALNGGFGNAPQRRSRYECTTCNKSFHSYQALGGHRASHKRVKIGFGSSINGGENSMETDASVERAAVKGKIDREASNGSSRKTKVHECMICGRLFQSGQALGGHKRSHLVAGSGCQTIVIQQEPSIEPDLLDLNLPAPVDGDSTSTNGNSDFKSWWARSELKHELVMGMISN